LYPISRFIDRDMVMRFHWGLAVGHLYAHDKREMPTQATRPYERLGEVEAINTSITATVDDVHHSSLGRAGVQPLNPNLDELVCDQGEFGLENREDNQWENGGVDDSGDTRGMGDDGWGEESDDEVFGAMHQMYGM
jgi:hypothetical protein